MKRQFETADLYLSSFIKTNLPDIKLTFTVQNGRTLFIFPISDTLYEAMASYNSGGLVNAFEYVQQLKMLRSEMYNRRRAHNE